MPGYEDLTRTLPAIETIINYIDRQAPIGAMNDAERHKSTLKLLPYQVAIRDMRPIAKSLSLDTTGFVLVERPSRVTNFWEPKQVEDVYFPEIKELIRDLTGCAKVVIFGHLLRHNGKDAPAAAHKSVHNAHIDYDLPTTRAVVERMLPPDEAAYYADRRVMQINVWRPLVTVESAPLAVCDSSSVSRADLIYGPIGGNSQAGREESRRLEPRAQSGASLVLRAAHAAQRGAGVPSLRFRAERAAMGRAYLVPGPDQHARLRAAPEHRSPHPGAVLNRT